MVYTLPAAVLSGNVIDMQTGLPVSGVNILIEGSGLGISTDDHGEFALPTGIQGSYTLSAGHIGYEIKKLKVTLPAIQPVSIKLQPIYLEGEQVTITTSRADLKSASAAFTNVTSNQIRETYSTQEMPIFLESAPGVYAYSDAGNPQGYSYLKIRGFDQKRVTVLINGIPHNDPEDHQVYWVDMPDLAANVDDIQVQRGLGYSPYGPSAFGGSVNILTTPNPQEKRIEASYGFGSFNTNKMSALFNSGIVDNSYTVYGRFSRITSDGYRDNSGFEGWSYFLSGTRYGLDNTLTINIFGGPEKLHAAWDAVSESILDTNRTYNPIQYENTIDNFNQPHYEIHHSLKISDDVKLKNTLYYIRGTGYWEIYKAGWDGMGEYLVNYGLSENPDYVSPLVQQQWVDKDQWGWIPQVNYQFGRWDFTGGGLFKLFDSRHYGKIIWVENPDLGGISQPDFKDHDYEGDIWEASVFTHAVFKPTDRLNLIGDLQFRHMDVKFQQNEAGAFTGADLNSYELTHDFLNPKLGVSYELDEANTLYTFAGYAQREPSQREYWGAWVGPEDFGLDPAFSTADTLFENGIPTGVEWSEPLIDPEQMIDIELGARYISDKIRGTLNLYWIDFRNEVIPGGGMNLGYQVTYNADKTLHRGIEAEIGYYPVEELELYGNLSYSQNTFESDLFGDIYGGGESIKGNTIPLFPDIMANGRVSYQFKGNAGWSLKPWLSFRYIGEQYLENTNDDKAKIDPYFVADLGLLFELPEFRSFPEIKIQTAVNNLLDEQYETSGYYYSERYLYPGAERNFYVGLTLGL